MTCSFCHSHETLTEDCKGVCDACYSEAEDTLSVNREWTEADEEARLVSLGVTLI